MPGAPVADAAVDALGMLHHDHGIGARRDRRAGHDFHRLATAHGSAKTLAGADLSDHLQLAGQVARADCVPIPDGTSDGRRIAVGGDILGEHAAGRLPQLDGLAGWEVARAANLGKHALARLRETQRGHSVILPREALPALCHLSHRRLDPARLGFRFFRTPEAAVEATRLRRRETPVCCGLECYPSNPGPPARAGSHRTTMMRFRPRILDCSTLRLAFGPGTSI